MIKVLILFHKLFHSASSQLNPAGCGNTTFGSVSCGTQSRIIGGTEVSLGIIPWQVFVNITFTRHFIVCGGTILTSSWVLSAAHCYVTNSGAKVAASSLKVSVGFVDLKIEPAVLQVMTVHIHESFSVCSHKNDIAMLKLRSPLVLGEIIKPICIPTDRDRELFVGKIGLISGWGTQTQATHADLATKLAATTVKVISNADSKCTDETMKSPPDIEMCAYETGHDSGNGDSGGPLTIFSKGACLQVGVISGSGVQTCTTKLAGIYTRVNKFYNWIKKHVDSD